MAGVRAKRRQQGGEVGEINASIVIDVGRRIQGRDIAVGVILDRLRAGVLSGYLVEGCGALAALLAQRRTIAGLRDRAAPIHAYCVAEGMHTPAWPGWRRTARRRPSAGGLLHPERSNGSSETIDIM